ncbi:MAG: hypothetical protein Q7S40_21920 [Opitutaceae bacterium]|nr:hypothetical protein [Opitutaceae bacterium]
MRTPKFLRLALLAAVPFTLFADEKRDRHIEEAAKTSYTFRRVLGNEIDLKVRDGVATLNGHVRDG